MKFLSPISWHSADLTSYLFLPLRRTGVQRLCFAQYSIPRVLSTRPLGQYLISKLNVFILTQLLSTGQKSRPYCSFCLLLKFNISSKTCFVSSSFIVCLVCVVLGIEPRALCWMIGRHCTTGLHPLALCSFAIVQDIH